MVPSLLIYSSAVTAVSYTGNNGFLLSSLSPLDRHRGSQFPSGSIQCGVIVEAEVQHHWEPMQLRSKTAQFSILIKLLPRFKYHNSSGLLAKYLTILSFLARIVD